MDRGARNRESLTPADARALKFIVDYEAKFRCGPSIGVLRKAMRFKSKTSAVQTFARLERRGLIRRSGAPLDHTNIRSIQATGRAQ